MSMYFPDRLKRKRLLKGYSQKKLAEVIGASRRQVIYWERGEGMPQARYLQALAKVLDTTTEELLGQQETGQDFLESQWTRDRPAERESEWMPDEFLAKVQALKETDAMLIEPLVDRLLGKRKRREVERDPRQYLEQVRLWLGPEVGEAAKLRIYRPPDRQPRLPRPGMRARSRVPCGRRFDQASHPRGGRDRPRAAHHPAKVRPKPRAATRPDRPRFAHYPATLGQL
jgi:transcriptional regulator with XRE-family HTH domain